MCRLSHVRPPIHEGSIFSRQDEPTPKNLRSLALFEYTLQTVNIESSVGCEVGRGVGVGVGDGVGLLDGRTVGFEVGVSVGGGVGLRVGRGVGIGVG